MRKLYVGLDVHSKSSVYAIQDEAGTLIGEGSVATTLEGLLSLRSRYDLPAGSVVGLETGTVAFHVARVLHRMELTPQVIDAHEVRLKAHRPQQKSDRRDAREICEGVRRGLYRSIVHVPSEAISALRETLGRRRHFVRTRTAEVNATKRLLRASGLHPLARMSLRTEKAWGRLEKAVSSDATLLRLVACHHALWTSAGVQIAALEEMLEQQRAPFAEAVGRLQSVPGVGPLIALTAIAVFADVDRFVSAKHAASYAGLVPSTHQSGERDAHGRITRRGSAELRAMLCEAAHHARLPNHPLNPYFRMLCVRRGYKMAVVAVAHRLCRILWSMLRRGTCFDPQRLNVERGPFEKTSTQLYRLKPRQATATA
jgi:transposase